MRKPILKPKTIIKFLMIFLIILGGSFLLISAISTDFQFVVLGSVLLITALCLFPITRLQEEKMEVLIKNGKRTLAYVLRIKNYWFMNLGAQSLETTIKPSPYRIFYEYEHNGQKYMGHSCLLWEPLALSRGHIVHIIIDENDPKKNSLDVDFLPESKERGK